MKNFNIPLPIMIILAVVLFILIFYLFSDNTIEQNLP